MPSGASPHILDTIGGIRINERMEVLDIQDKPIRGLYAAGVATSGWEAETYCSDLSGSAFGFAINSGRIAGENAAAFIYRHEITYNIIMSNNRFEKLLEPGRIGSLKIKNRMIKSGAAARYWGSGHGPGLR